MDSIKKLKDLFAKFPTVGQRTAGRFVFYLINQPKEDIDELARTLQELKNNITFCRFCFQPFENAGKTLCEICSEAARNRQLLCIVEKETDLLSIENAKRYKGLYFVLGGVVTFRKTDTDHLRIEALKERIQSPQKFELPGASFTEIIIATNPTPEGKATSLLIQRALKELPQAAGIKITHLAQGLPVGGELEYADEETLESAFNGRK